jgi:hypothetical protein
LRGGCDSSSFNGRAEEKDLLLLLDDGSSAPAAAAGTFRITRVLCAVLTNGLIILDVTIVI